MILNGAGVLRALTDRDAAAAHSSSGNTDTISQGNLREAALAKGEELMALLEGTQTSASGASQQRSAQRSELSGAPAAATANEAKQALGISNGVKVDPETAKKESPSIGSRTLEYLYQGLGTVGGAAVGAGLGAIVGSVFGHPGIGAAVGALALGGLGFWLSDKIIEPGHVGKSFMEFAGKVAGVPVGLAGGVAGAIGGGLLGFTGGPASILTVPLGALAGGLLGGTVCYKGVSGIGSALGWVTDKVGSGFEKTVSFLNPFD